jgi:hypothetical protein
MDRRSAAKDVTDPAPGPAAIDLPGEFCQAPMAEGPCYRPLVPVRSTGRPAGEVIPASRGERAGWLSGGQRASTARLVRPLFSSSP